MNAFPVRFGIGFAGTAVGIPTNTKINTSLGRTAGTSATLANWQAYDACSRVPLTIVAGGTVTLNLATGATGLLNPLGEAISAFPFAHVFAVLVWHDVTSLASAITAFGGGSGNLFQGPWNATAQMSLTPGQRNGFSTDANLTGFVVDGTHKNVDFTNSDGAHAATVNVFIMGTTN